MSNTSYKAVIKKGSYTAKGFGPGLDLETALIDFMLSKGLATNPSGDSCTLVCCGGSGGGGGFTNLSWSRTDTTVTVISDTGSDAVLPFATETQAGVMTADDKIKLDSLGATTGTPNELAFFDGSGTLNSYGQSYTDGNTMFLRVPNSVRTSARSPYNSDAPLFLRHVGNGNLDIRFGYEGIDIFKEVIAPTFSRNSAGFIFQQTYTSAGTTVRTPLVGDFLSFMGSRITKNSLSPFDPYYDGSSQYIFSLEVSSINGGTHEVGTTLKLYTRKNTDPINTTMGGNAFLIGDENGDITLPYYPFGRDDAGSPTNILSTDTNGKIISNPVTIFAQKALNEIITGAWTFNQNVTIPLTPINPTDAVSKSYVDSLSFGLVKHYVNLATTANITLSGEQTIDGVLTSASRVLVHNQTLQQNNGVYLTAAGAWTRVTDVNDASKTNHALVIVISGSANASTFWTTAADIVTIGTDNQIWVDVNPPFNLIAGTGCVLTGNILDVQGTSGRIVANANSLDLIPTAVTIGSYGTSNLIPTFTVDTYGRLTAAGSIAVSISNNTLNQLSDVNIVAPTNGQVLTYDIGTSMWINTTISTAAQEGFINGFVGATIDLDANVGNVKDYNGNNIAVTLSAILYKNEFYRNGVRQRLTGTLTTRGYTLNLGTNSVTFNPALVSTDEIYIQIRN